MKRTLLALTLIIGAAAMAAGCGDDTPKVAPATSSPSTVASKTTQPTEPSATAATATSLPATPVVSTPVPTTSPVPTTTPAPFVRVLWATVDAGGAGVAVIRFATDVPTTASIYNTAQTPGKPSPVPHQEDLTLATMHTISIPAGPTSEWAIEVTNASKTAMGHASVRTKLVYAESYFFDDKEPAIAMQPGRKAVVTWLNQRNSRPRPEAAGTVYLFAKPAGCTVAQACVPELVTTFTDQPTVVDAQTEKHAVSITFPDTTRTYFVVLGGVPGPNGVGEYFQINPKSGDIQP